VGHPEVDWGVYAAAVRRWEQVLGRPAPFPTQPGRHGSPVLAPAFVEWLQGLEPGWVASLELPRTAQLRALGNGVVPQQAAHAVGLLLTDLAGLLGDTADERRRIPGRRRTRGDGYPRATEQGQPLRGQYCLHRSCQPLAEVDLDPPATVTKRHLRLVSTSSVEEDDPDGCSPWSCRSGTAVAPERAA
jgi:DNA (cytosine-5)-methyltransferase 1